MACPVCQTELVYFRDSTVALVGYCSPVGHEHDDNCRISYFCCENGHSFSERKQNTCPACDWKGKLDCFCHPLGFRVYEARAAEKEK